MALTESTGLVSLLSTWGSNGPTLVKWEPGRLQAAVRLREGRNLPMLTTATGRVFLAHQSLKEMRSLLDAEIKARNADKARALSTDDVQALRDDVRHRGVGQSSGEENPGLTAVAAPVFDHEGRLALVISLVGIIGTFSIKDDAEPVRILLATADQLSRRLGAPQSMVRDRSAVVSTSAQTQTPPKRVDAKKEGGSSMTMPPCDVCRLKEITVLPGCRSLRSGRCSGSGGASG